MNATGDKTSLATGTAHTAGPLLASSPQCRSMKWPISLVSTALVIGLGLSGCGSLDLCWSRPNNSGAVGAWLAKYCGDTSNLQVMPPFPSS